MDNNPEIRIRFAFDSDSSFIRDLSTKAFSPFGDYGEVVLSWHNSGKSITVIACYEENPLGFAMVSSPFSRYDHNCSSELLAIAIETVWQGRGIGKLLIKRMEKIAIEAGILTIFLHTAVDNRHARKLFLDTGYRIWQIKKNFYPMGQDACIMAKILKK